MLFNHILQDITLDNVIAAVRDYESKEVPRIRKAYRYVNGDQDILRKETAEGRENNRIVDNKCRKVVDNYLGFANPQGLETTDQFLNDNLPEISDVCKDTLIAGVGYAWVYYDKNLTIRRLYPTRAMVFRDNTISNKVVAGCTWNRYTVIENGYSVEYIDLYLVDETYCYYFKGKTLESLVLEDTFSHHVQGIPIIEFKANSHYDGVIDPIYSLQDLVNITLSSYADGRSIFSDPFLCITGIQINEEQASGLIDGEKKILNLPLPDSKADYLTRPDSGSDLVTLLKDIDDRIASAVNLPNLTDPRMAASSGSALRAKLIAFVNVVKQIRKAWDQGLYNVSLLTSNFTYEWPDILEDLDTIMDEANEQ